MRECIRKRFRAALLSVTAIALSGLLYSSNSNAEDSSNLVSIIPAESKSQLWINPGMASYHFQQDKNFNNGIGVQD